MTMVPRDEITVKQIADAKGEPTNREDEKHEPPGCKEAEAPAEGHPGAPSKLPGYGK